MRKREKPYMRRCLAATASALILCSPVGAEAAAVDITWTSDGGFTHQTQVASGKFVELCGKVDAGTSIRWSFRADTPLDFNIHYHVGKDVVYPTKQNSVSQGDAVLVAQVTQDYCWMWTNKAPSPVALAVELRR